MNFNTDFVSIIIPVYNGELFIKDAYELLINQNLRMFEIIFIDNNSTDHSVSIINDIIKSDSRVYLYHENIQGAASARNKGLQYSKGEFVYFFDVDDELFDSALNSLLSVLKTDYSIDSVYGNTVKSHVRLKDFQISKKASNNIFIPEPHYWGIKWMNYGTLPGTPSFLHRKRVFKRLGGFNPELKLGEDATFHIKLGMEFKVAHLDKDILLYYKHQNSTVSKQNKKQAKEFTYWEPLIKEHIPYIFTQDLPLAFKKEVLLRVYGYIPKMLALTKGYMARRNLYKRLLNDIKPINIPLLLRPFHYVICLTGSLKMYKAYFFNVLKPYIKHVLK